MLTVAYDGTEYAGWQVQRHAETIESVLNRELSRLLNEDIRVIGASRTDSGVHAEGAVCVFDTDSGIPADKFSFAVNQSLPSDIRVMSSREVRPDFHPRRTPCLKTYRYSIWNDTFHLPSKRLYTHWVHGPLDLEKMREAADFLTGEHDFKSFCKEKPQEIRFRPDAADEAEKSESPAVSKTGTVRRITAIEIKKEGHQVDIFVTGNGFLYNMVRIIAGTLIDAAQGRIEPSDMKEILEAKDRSRAGVTAPAKGLCLVEYDFWEI